MTENKAAETNMVPVTILTGFPDEAIGNYYLLDGVITLVD